MELRTTSALSPTVLTSLWAPCFDPSTRMAAFHTTYMHNFPEDVRYEVLEG